MDDDRKYRQRGYMESDRDSRERRFNDKPKPSGPRPPIDVTGPRLPRLLQNVTAARCFNCSTAVPQDLDWKTGKCPKCGASLHCCKQCAHFEPSTRFQCRKPIPVRIAVKDQVNDCNLFEPRVTVARDAAPVNNHHPSPVQQPPRSPNDARAAFDSLFKKPE